MRRISRAMGIAGIALAGMLLAFQTGCSLWRIGESASLSREGTAFQHHPEQPGLRLLLVGDSTGAGTGASSPQTSLAGLLARDFARLHIDNLARPGARFAQVLTQLDRAGRTQASYDLVLIMAGGNDVIRATRVEILEAQIDEAVQKSLRLAPEVVLLPPGNVGNAAFFFPPLSGIMTRRAIELHAIVRQVTQVHGAGYVNLFRSPEEDPFVSDRGLNASDGLHPSDAGYALWYQELMAQTDWPQRLLPARDAAP